MTRWVTLATCSLRQQALDFKGNYDRIVESIQEAKKLGAKFRVGPELEICGYACMDHFYEDETEEHSWNVLATLLRNTECHEILVETGMPIWFKGYRYNCRLILLNGKILLIRPKMIMANTGNYRESRWFTAWPRGSTDEYQLPVMIDLNGGTVPFGEMLLATNDTLIGFEVCEELFAPNSPHLDMLQEGVDIISNGSASHHEVGKFSKRVSLIRKAMFSNNGNGEKDRGRGIIYLYANQIGVDGDGQYYDGGEMILENGELLAVGKRFGLDDVSVTAAAINLDATLMFPNGNERNTKDLSINENNKIFRKIKINFELSSNILSCSSINLRPSSYLTTEECILPTEEDEILRGAACWLFDYLRRSGAKGFFLALSGGIDSACVAVIVYFLANILLEESSHENVNKFLQESLGFSSTDSPPPSIADICQRLFFTSYLSTKQNTVESEQLVVRLTQAIGSTHLGLSIDGLVNEFNRVISLVLPGFKPRFHHEGGCQSEHIALQNIQARLRMVVSYALAQLAPVHWDNNSNLALEKPRNPLLVLSTANASECLWGYYTKYDCSSGDINPIGSLDKLQIRAVVARTIEILHARREGSGLDNLALISVLEDILRRAPSAELAPLTPNTPLQTDELDMGINYERLSQLGRIRLEERAGPNDMVRLVMSDASFCDGGAITSNHLSRLEAESLVEKFFSHYGKNRHKAYTLPLCFHVTGNNPDGHNFDIRPILYPSLLSWKFSQSIKKDDLPSTNSSSA